jgi:hypothetical protein
VDEHIQNLIKWGLPLTVVPFVSEMPSIDIELVMDEGQEATESELNEMFDSSPDYILGRQSVNVNLPNGTFELSR